MATESHKRAQRKAAGKNGRREVPLNSGKKLDALSPSGRATEVERGHTRSRLDLAAQRLKEAKRQGAKQATLRVPQSDMRKATEAMRRKNVTGTVSNLGGTQSRRVR